MSIQRCCPPAKVHRANFGPAAGVMGALAEPHRLAMVATLARAQSEVCVCDFTDGLSLGQPAVSHHLKVLREAGLVQSRRHGTWVYYTLSPDVRERLAAIVDFIMPDRGRK